jgi:hypothetical protein
MRTRIASFLGALTVATGTLALSAPTASANDYHRCLDGSREAGLHETQAKDACATAEGGDVAGCAKLIAKQAKPPVKGDADAAQRICGKPAEPPPD